MSGVAVFALFSIIIVLFRSAFAIYRTAKYTFLKDPRSFARPIGSAIAGVIISYICHRELVVKVALDGVFVGVVHFLYYVIVRR